MHKAGAKTTKSLSSSNNGKGEVPGCGHGQERIAFTSGVGLMLCRAMIAMRKAVSGVANRRDNCQITLRRFVVVVLRASWLRYHHGGLLHTTTPD